MPAFVRSRTKKAGLPPGTPVHVGERKVEDTRINAIYYDEAQARRWEVESVGPDLRPDGGPGVTWINVDGLHQVDLLAQIGEILGLHPLVVEDIANTDHRPKAEEYGEYSFLVFKSLYHVDEESDQVQVEQISLVLGPGYVITFQEQPGDEFDPVRDRILADRGRIRQAGADYLAYVLVYLVVDQYFAVLEWIGDQIESLEEELIGRPSTETLQAIYRLKRTIASVRKAIWPLREAIGQLQRDGSALIAESTRLYLRDVYDHTVQVIDTTETFRDTISGMLDIYLSSVSNRMNEVMKVLTVIATVFIPLTFIAGVYGMNFEHMPELAWRWAYPAVWAIMILIGGAMIVYFWRKGWL